MCYPVHPVLLEYPSSPPQVVLPPPHQSMIAGRVRSHLPQWKKISGPWHTKTIMDGIPLQWVQDPPPFNRPFDSAISLRSRSREYNDSSALSRNRLRGPITKSGRDGWSLVNILPGGQEGDGQASGLHRSQDNQYIPSIRALQDGGHSYFGKHAPPPRLDDQDRPLRLLHAPAYSRCSTA